MNRYPSYKKTGIRWLSHCPSHWDIVPSKRIFENPKEKNMGRKEKNVLSLTLKGVLRNDPDNPIGLAPADYSSYQIFEKDDLVFKLIDLENASTSRVGLVPERGIMSSAYIRFSLRNSSDEIRYFYYQYYDLWQRLVFNGLGAGVRQTLSADDLGLLKIIIPPQAEQRKIVAYIDWKTSEINRLINGYQKQIALLNEYRQTLIDDAVTHGIDNAPLKQSGVSWVCEIPEQWNMVYAKKLFSQRKEKACPNDDQLTASQKYGVISQSHFMELENRRLTVVVTGEDILKHVAKGDFVLSMRSFQGGLEYSEVDGKISSAYVMLIPNKEKVYSPFFKWLLKSKHYIKALQGTSDLVRDGQALRYTNFSKVALPEIPMDEQIRISEYINQQVRIIDSLISKVKQKIGLLKEYKSALISNVVTGQVDVRDVEVPEYETVELSDTDSDVEAEAEG